MICGGTTVSGQAGIPKSTPRCRYGRSGSVLSVLADLEAVMGNKDKGGRNTKKQATRNLKEKRAEKKVKREAAKSKRNSGPF